MFRVTYENYAGNDCVFSCKIEKVTLTLRRIMEQNNAENGFFVPVWDFYGTTQTTYKNEPPSEFFSNNRPLLTINAIDGTVIDLNRGY